MSEEQSLESLLRQTSSSRRARPPNMSDNEDAPVPLRPQLAKRESRLGLRSLFGRKAPKEADAPEQKPTRSATRSAGIRASIVDMSSWSYGHQTAKPDVKEPSIHISRPLSTTVEHPTIEEMQSRTQTKNRNTKHLGKAQKPALVPWDAPPLFKAYPQAIKHSTLPCSSLSPDVILRMRAKKAGEAAGETPAPEVVTEWTTKIYLLVTSGALLQYSSEGPFDRLPEKVLQLGKASAAFASDVIPGRHWVLQVSSALEADGTNAADQRSLFSRLPFRVTERRQASNFLMVFENADDMDGWLATLRREIEALGGKKTLSETGKPKAAEPAAGLREQPSQRTLVVRDPDRFSKTFSVESSWREGSEAGEYEASTDNDTRDQSLDGTSTTNSFVSHDGRQLENLRDSSHRLSAISSGQRTVVTSEGSSPSCSPTRDSFPSSSEEERPPHEDYSSHSAEARLRPNASAISNRRRSMQTFGQFVDGREGSQRAARAPSTMLSPPIPEASIPPSTSATPVTPNFSVPHSSSRRFSYIKPKPEHAAPLAPPSRPAPRKVPAPLNLRPLSMVIDQPPPHVEGDVSERPATRHGDGRASHTVAREPVPSSRRGSFTLPSSSGRILVNKRSSLLPREASNAFGVAPQPRRLASMTSLRSSEQLENQPRRESFGKRMSAVDMSLPPMRSASPYDREGALSPTPFPASKRASMFSGVPDRSGRRDRRSEMPLPFVPESLPQPTPPPSMPLPPLPPSASYRHLPNARSSKLLSSRSLPQLLDGPPPAPPPSCALPPIPQRLSVRA